jgi:hypothetical protein
MAALFRKMGYQCVLTSEHDSTFDEDRWQRYRKACAEISTEDFLIVPGIEYSDRANVVHVLVWGMDIFLGESPEIGELLLKVKERDGVAVLAHPSRRDAWRHFDATWLPLLSGIEQWNRKVDGVAPSSEAISMIVKRPALLPFVGLDFHRWNQLFPLAMSLHLGGRLSEGAVLGGLRGKSGVATVAGLGISHLSQGIPHGIVSTLERFRRFLRRVIR